MIKVQIRRPIALGPGRPPTKVLPFADHCSNLGLTIRGPRENIASVRAMTTHQLLRFSLNVPLRFAARRRLS